MRLKIHGRVSTWGKEGYKGGDGERTGRKGEQRKERRGEAGYCGPEAEINGSGFGQLVIYMMAGII